MPPKIATPPTSGRASPVLQNPLPRSGAAPAGSSTSTPSVRTQQAPADTTMPPPRTPSRSSSAAATSPSRPRSPVPGNEGKKPELTPTTGALVLAARPATVDAAPEVESPAVVGKPGETSTGKTPRPLAPAAITEADVAKVRGEFLGELDQLGMALVKAGADPAQLHAARHPTEQSLTEALHTMTQSDGDPAALSPEEHEAIAVMDAYVKGETAPPATAAGTSGTLAQQVLHEASTSTLGDHPPATGNSAADKFLRAGRALHAALKRVNANEDFGPKATVAASVANVSMRNFAAVWIPTLLRQYVSYGLEAGLEKVGAGDTARAAMGAIAPAGAVLSLGVGAVRDRMNGTHTRTSEASRAIMATAITGATVATLATGAMPAMAPLTAAFGLYCFKRDVVVQSRLRLSNGDNPVPDKKHWSAISLLYGADQGIVNAAMSLLASPSGAAAKVAQAGVQSGNAFARATINWLGENAEDLMFQGIPALRSYFDKNQQGKPLRLSIQDVGYQSTHVKNALLGPLAVRTGILACTLGTTAIAARYIGSDKAVEIASDLIVAGYNAVLYHPFANAGSGQPQVADAEPDLEQGHDAPPPQAGTELTATRHGAPATTSA